MANVPKYTGVYARTLTISDFDTSQYDGLSITAGIPVTLKYRVLPGQRVSLGSGSQSLNGVCTSKVFQLKAMDEQATPVEIPCRYTFQYADPNEVNATTLKQDLTANCNIAPNSYTSDVQAVSARLPETSGVKIGAYAYIKIILTPISTSAGHTFNKTNTQIQIPITVYTLPNASGQ